MNKQFVPVKTIEGVHCAPLRPCVEHYIAELKEQGYDWRTVTLHVQIFAHLGRWFQRSRRPLWNFDETEIQHFLQRHLARTSPLGAEPALHRLLALMRKAGVAAPAVALPRTPAQSLADEYRVFLARERGLESVTISHNARHAERFLHEHFNRGKVTCANISAGDVRRFVQRHSLDGGRGLASQLVSSLRSFFRFLHYRGLTRDNLSAAVPTVANWRMAHLPKHLPPEAVHRILASCSQTAVGLRDHAILLLLARLGLRASEIVHMQLEDIDWDNAQIVVRSKKGRGWARMPLPCDAGRALAHYLKSGRPMCASRHVFVRFNAPHRRFAASATVSGIAKAAIKRVGVESRWNGAHVFRHSLATEMLRQGASLHEIGQVLRHKDVDTTAIYAKVDLASLRKLVVALPGGAS